MVNIDCGKNIISSIGRLDGILTASCLFMVSSGDLVYSETGGSLHLDCPPDVTFDTPGLLHCQE